jgi:phosphate transport system ATP-binding protein
MPHISLSNLTIAYGNHQVLKDITVDIPDGQITVIIGPSGCGKTTLLKSLNRLTDLYEDMSIRGEVRIDGVNIHDPRADVLALRKKVGFLSSPSLPCPSTTTSPSAQKSTA